MRFRSVIGAIGAAAVLAATLVLGAGTASATAPAPDRTITCGSGLGSVSGSTCTLPRGGTCPVVTGSTSCDVTVPGFRRGFPGGFPGGLNGGLYGGGFNGLNGLGGFNGLNLTEGNVLVLGDGTSVDVCDTPQWNGFYGQFGNRLDGRFGSLRGQLNELRYEQLLSQAGCNTGGIIVNGSLNGLNLVEGNQLNLNSYGVVGGSVVNVCSFPNYGAFSSFGVSRFGDRFNGFGSRFGGVLNGGGWGQLRARANCQAVVVNEPIATSVVQAPTAVAPAVAPTEDAPAPAADPAAGSGVVNSAPRGAPDTGDGSTVISG